MDQVFEAINPVDRDVSVTNTSFTLRIPNYYPTIHNIGDVKYEFKTGKSSISQL